MNGQRGTMVVSLDLELCWGRFDKVPVPMLEADASEERIQIRRLLALLDRYEIPATWAIVGHLMLAGCSRHDGAVHMDVTPRPDYSWFPKTGTFTIPAQARFNHPVGMLPTFWNGSGRPGYGMKLRLTPSGIFITVIPNAAPRRHGPISQLRWRLRQNKTSR
jgi:hypothetical protein